MILGVPKTMVLRLGWIALSFGVIQILRLLNNVILTRLLDPSIFGLMSLVIAIRVGMELISDVGVTQNIVSNPRGHEPDFYDTAWTWQALRGIALTAICAMIGAPLASFFGHPELALILPVIALTFLFSGFDSTARGLISKDIKIVRLGVFEIAKAALTIAVYAGAALLFPNVWAIVLGVVTMSAVTLIISFLYIPGMRHRFIIDRESARQLFQFGKWVFLSSIVYFFAMNFDRLYFAKQITLAELGIYGIARNLADVATQLVLRGSSSVLYPTVAASGLEAAELRTRLLKGRRTLLFAAAVALGGFLALSGIIVAFLYDPRYQQAGIILPILCVGVWFSILASTNDSILMGLSRPAYPALSNAAKLISYVVGMPIAFHYFGFMGAITVIAAGEFVKYMVLWVLSHKEHLRFGRDDLMLTLAFAVTGLLSSELIRMLGFGTTHHVSLRALMAWLGL